MRVSDEVYAAVERFEHSETEQIELHETDGRAVLLVPLQGASTGHPGPLDRTDLTWGPVTYAHPARVQAEMARKVEDVGDELRHQRRHPGTSEGVAMIDGL